MLRDRAAAGRVVFVCEGNTCRSPLAEVIARSMFGGCSSRFFSVGLAARPGDPAPPHAVAAAAELGLDLTGHRARSLAGFDAGGTVWCIAMDRSQAARLRALGAAGGGAIGILGAPGVDVGAARATPACEEIPDPWDGDLDTYRLLARRIARLLEAWRPFLGDEPCEGEGT